MTDAAEGNGEFSPKKKKKMKVGFRRKQALLEIIRRKQFGTKVDYSGIVARHGSTKGSWKTLYYRWKCGMVDLGEAETPEEKTINAQMQHELTLLLVKRHKALVLKGYEQLLNRCEDELSTGKLHPKDIPSTGLGAVLKELRNLMVVQAVAEQGYSAILDELMEKRVREEKHLHGNNEKMTRQVIGANDEQRALALVDKYMSGSIEVASEKMPPNDGG